MNCDRARDLVSTALDGALSEGQEQRFRQHLEDCPPCRAFYGELRDSLALLGELPQVDTTESFEDSVWRRIRAAEAPRSRPAMWKARLEEFFGSLDVGGSFWRWSPVGVAAGVLMLFAISSPPETPVGSGELARSVPAEPAREPAEDTASDSEVLASAEEVEVEAGMPEAVENYLRSARDLRLSSDPDRFRRSNYSYPLRHVQGVANGSLTGRPAVQTPKVDADVTVIAF